MKRLLSILIAAAMLSSLLAGCGRKKETTSSNETAASGSGQLSGAVASFQNTLVSGAVPDAAKKSDTVKLSPDVTSATTKDGVTVELGDYILDGAADLTVKKQPVEENQEEGYKIESYDFSLGGMHELDDFITIRIPYDTDFCEEGQDPARCVGAKYKNEETGEWEDVLFEVDAEAQELVIYTDHLSFYGAFYVENEGRRDAYITDVYDTSLYMNKNQTLDFARRIAEDDPSVVSELTEVGAKASGLFFDYADRIDNAINIATLGDVPDWLSTEIPETNQTLFSAIGYISTCTNLLKIAVKDSAGKGADKGEVLNLIRDVGTKVTGYWADAFTSVGSGALSVGMGGVLVIDKMLTAFAEEAKATKLEDISYVYHHFNEGFHGYGHKPMTPKDWRAKVIAVLEKHPNDPELAMRALEAGFTKYASEFFELNTEQMNVVASDTPLVTVRRVPNITEAEKNQLIDEYIAHLKSNTMPAVLTSVENYMIKKAEQQQIEAVNKVKEYNNSKISITIKEDIREGDSSRYKGYQFRLAPLNDRAVAKNWSGIWPENGIVRSSATLMGFRLAGFPHTVEFFKPDADMNKDAPELVVPFVISIPAIDITIRGAEPLAAEAFMGDWVNENGRRTVLILNGDSVIKKEPDLPWYGGDVVCIEYRVKESADPQTLELSGTTSWVEGPESLHDVLPEGDRRLVVDASSAGAAYSATKVDDGIITEMTSGSNTYTRP